MPVLVFAEARTPSLDHSKNLAAAQHDARPALGFLDKTMIAIACIQ